MAFENNRLTYSWISLAFCVFFILFSCEKADNNTEAEKFIDSRDSQVYKYVKIGNQIWMTENLNYATDSGSWIYDNELSNSGTYGRLYDWEAACKFCPDGWHLPSDQEWKELEIYLGIDTNEYYLNVWELENVVGTELKAETGWGDNLSNGTNSTGFTALPGGEKDQGPDGVFFRSLGYDAYFWSSSGNSEMAIYRKLSGTPQIIRKQQDITNGYSVRCIKD